MINQKEKEGSYNEWDKVWRNYDDTKSLEQKNVLYSNGTPITILQFWQKCYFEDLKYLIKGKNYQKFLELGSGRGTTSMFLAAEGMKDITMVDLSETAFCLAAENFKQQGFILPKMILANVENTGLPSETFDCIYNIGLLEHFHDPAPTLKEAYRLLKPGGLIFMPIVPELVFSKSIINRVFFNPLSIPKYLLKTIFFDKKNNNATTAEMIRTDTSKSEYMKIAKKAGFIDSYCIAYNPYWKVNTEGWFEKNVTLSFYKIHYKIKKALSKPPLLKTKNYHELCFLLVGYKK